MNPQIVASNLKRVLAAPKPVDKPTKGGFRYVFDGTGKPQTTTPAIKPVYQVKI